MGLLASPPARPNVTPVVGKACVMRLAVRAWHRNLAHRFAVGHGCRVGVSRDELAAPVAQAADAEGSDVDEVLLAFDQLGEKRGVAGFASPRKAGDEQ